MLTNVHSPLETNLHVKNALHNIVVPAVRSHEAMIRELGLRCLGLVCLLDKNLSVENLPLFVHCFNRGHEALQVEVLKVICDMLMVHGAGLFWEEGTGTDRMGEKRTFMKFWGKALRLKDAWEVQATAAEVGCKLLLAQVIKDEEVRCFGFRPDSDGVS